MKNVVKFLLLLIALTPMSFVLNAQTDDDVIDEVIWVIGDDAILFSDVENLILQMQFYGQTFDGDPYCMIPEQLAIQKLFIHQARLDSVEVTDSDVLPSVEERVNGDIRKAGSREQLEVYTQKTIAQYRRELIEMMRDQYMVERMKAKLVENIKVTPTEVRNFYNKIPQDSLPYIPTTVEVEIFTLQPKIELVEIDEIKARLRDYTDQVNSGKAQFSTLARLYSQDGSASFGGEIGFMGRGMLEPEYAAAAFDLNEPGKVSRIVETEYGYHIIQLIEKRGDRVNTRHILLKPEPSREELEGATARLDSVVNDVKKGDFTFEEAVLWLSDDADTRMNGGLMVNNDMTKYTDRTGTPRFELSELPSEIARRIEFMEVGEISLPFTMINSKQKKVAAVVRLKTKTLGHRASLTDDFQTIKTMVENSKKEKLLNDWIAKKQRETYIRIKDGWKDCEFQKDGWIQ